MRARASLRYGVGRLARLAVGLLALALAPCAAGTTPPMDAGEYLFRAAGCEGCHTDVDAKGPRLAGGRRLETPLGVFYSPNITPDPVHGIGRWRDADFIRALREGVSPEGRHYYPAFPYPAYTRLSDADMLAIKAYLFRQPPVARRNTPHQLPWYLRLRPLLSVWKALYFRPGAYVDDARRSAGWNRGAYLAQAATHCGECHTPRNLIGGFRRGLYYAGTKAGPEGSVVPNITPDKATGIGRWSRSDLEYYLESGATPEGDFAGDLMAEVIDNSLAHLRKADRRAIATYVRSLPPISHAVRKARPANAKDEFDY